MTALERHMAEIQRLNAIVDSLPLSLPNNRRLGRRKHPLHMIADAFRKAAAVLVQGAKANAADKGRSVRRVASDLDQGGQRDHLGRQGSRGQEGQSLPQLGLAASHQDLSVGLHLGDDAESAAVETPSPTTRTGGEA
ncbi:hypothetical protein [Brevundimonas sp. BAL3]|uniref:hypothetical protein n=1 Tax=Brevundimonas sp. BAL3 TaxID=391600 RepID=UPI0012EAF357|nr:hypothetical protein [Brevundimonas sp. BAL3]